MRRPQGLVGTIAQFVHFLAEEKWYKKKPYADYDPCPRPMAWARVKQEPYADYDPRPRPTAWARVKSPELSMGPDSSSSINLGYLKLSRWRSRCRFPTPFSFDWRINHGNRWPNKLEYQQAWYLYPLEKARKIVRKFWQINTQVTNCERHAYDYINGQLQLSRV